MNTPTVATRLSFLAAAAVMTLALFASAADLADVEHEAAMTQHAAATAASQPRVLVAAGTPNHK